MKTKVKVETVVQPLYRIVVHISGMSKNFYCNANSIEEALQLAKEKCPNFTIGYAFECTSNWTLER